MAVLGVGGVFIKDHDPASASPEQTRTYNNAAPAFSSRDGALQAFQRSGIKD